MFPLLDFVNDKVHPPSVNIDCSVVPCICTCDSFHQWKPRPFDDAFFKLV